MTASPSIRAKVLAAICAVVAAMAVLGAAILHVHARAQLAVERERTAIVSHYRVFAETERMVDLYNASVLQPANPDLRHDVESCRDGIVALLGDLDALALGDDIQPAYRGLRNSALHLVDLCNQGLAAKDARDALLTDRIYGDMLRLLPFVAENSSRTIFKEARASAQRHAATRRLNARRLAALALLVAFAVLAGLAYAVRVARKLTRPLGRLSAIALDIANGNLSARVDADLVARNDEVGSLSRSFDHMLSHLRRTLDDLGAQIRERQLAEARADQANRAKSAFLANMSHEIRTPLNGVLGMTELLLMSNLPPRERRCAQVVQSSANNLMALLNDILDYSKIEAGKLSVESIDFVLADMLEPVVASMDVLARKKNLDASARVAPNVPARLRGDPARLRQILNNLVANAVKFTESGHVRIEIETIPAPPGDAPAPPGRLWLRFSVADTGIGIPADRQPSIFDLFAQADSSTSRRYGGTGLGLAICRQLATLLGGSIDLASAEGQGSEFRVLLPFDAAAESASALLPDTPKSALPPSPPATRILVAEDTPLNQEVVVSMLESMGLSADVASDGRQALAAIQRKSYDLVLMDVQMPGLDGLETTRLVRASEIPSARTPIVAMTAFVMPGDRERCLESGMNDYLSKPIEWNALVAILQRWLPGWSPDPN